MNEVGAPMFLWPVPPFLWRRQKASLNVLDAIRALEDSMLLADTLGPLVPAYLKLKKHEWDD